MSTRSLLAWRRASAMVALSFALLPALAAAAPAPTPAPLTIDFESWPGIDYMPGTLVTPGSRLADQYLTSHGVRFSSGAGYAALLNLGPNHAYSGLIGVGATSTDGRLHYGADLRVSFFDVASGESGVTDFVAWTTDRLGDGRDVTLTAYDVEGVQIAQQTWADTGWKQISLSVQGIHSVVFRGAGYAALDNLSFNAVTLPTSPVPEPGSMALVGAGLVALSYKARRRLGRAAA